MPGLEESDLRAGFIRQRRNLLVISLVLVFSQAADLTIQTINILGTTVLIAEPTAIFKALWIGWAYWFWRYWTFHTDAHDRVVRRRFRDKFNKNLFRIAEKATRYDHSRKGRQLLPQDRVGVNRIASRKWKVKLNVIESTDGTRSGTVTDWEYTVSGWEFWRTYVFSMWQVVVSSSTFSEFMLPYIAGTFPILNLTFELL